MSFTTDFTPTPLQTRGTDYGNGVLVCAWLQDAGYEAYVVGGWVRDALLGRVPHDCDVCSSAVPAKVTDIFSKRGIKSVPTGEKYGTVSIIFDKYASSASTTLDKYPAIEVTTFRGESGYSDGRHPDEVSFTSELDEDLKRRDFTVNAIAYDPIAKKIHCIDELCLTDIKLKTIRCIGDPDSRFREDALRMLRAIRFCATLGFQLNAETANAIRRNADLIRNVSPERIRDELTKILVSERPEALLMAHELGLTRYFLPEFDLVARLAQNNPWHRMPLADHTFAVVRGVDPNNATLRWAAFLHDFGKPFCRSTDHKGIDHFFGHPAVSARMAEEICRRLKFDNGSIDRIVHLCEMHDRMTFPFDASEKIYRRAIADIGVECFPEWAELVCADIMGHSMKAFQAHMPALSRVKDIYANPPKEGKVAFRIKDLAIGGTDVCRIMGIEPGPMVGRVLRFLLRKAIEDPAVNTEEGLGKLVEQYMNGEVTENGYE